MRVGIVALLHESNTFISEPTTLEKFQQEVLVSGEAVREKFAASHHEVGGFFAGLEQQGIEAVPIFAARAIPFGTITAETFDTLVRMMFEHIAAAGPLDGILAAPHGATVAANHRDADGYWLTELRRHFPREVGPIVATIDPHANLSPAMVAATDALVAYRTNPHIDQRDRGIEAANLIARALRNKTRLTQAAAFPPMAIDITRQLTTEPPCTPLYDHANRLVQVPGVLSNSIVLGFPYADVAEMGSAAVVVTDNDPQLARRLADDLARDMWEHRRDFVGEHISVDEAVRRARALPDSARICLLDTGDNVGGGSPGDGTLLAHALDHPSMRPSFVCIFDPAAAQQAIAAGLHARLMLRMGGKTDTLHGPPLESEFTVLAITDGKFAEPQARHGGFTSFDQGPTAVVRTDTGLTIMLTAKRVAPFSLQQIRHAGLDPASFRYLVAKGVNAPVAAYQEVCNHFIRVSTPGVTAADMTTFTYHHRRRPMFPFEPDTTW
jgi:microcystin degradation protein MlrC